MADTARMGTPIASGGVTLVLVHGAGHTAAVWQAVRQALATPSVAVDLPGRGSRPGDLSAVTVRAAAEAITDDIAAAVDGEVVLVGHSVAGIVLPVAAAGLGERVRELVFVAGIAAAEGERPVDLFLPGQQRAVAEHLADLRGRYGGQRLEDIDPKSAASIDSLNLSSHVMTWVGVPDATPRTFVRCLRDPIQPRPLQDVFIRHSGATTVVDIDAGHTPAIEAPQELAAILDRVAAGARRAAG